MSNDIKTNKVLIEAIVNNASNVKELISRATLEELNAECSVDDKVPILIAAKYNPKLIIDIINAGAYSGIFADDKHFIKTLGKYNKDYLPQLIKDCVNRKINDCKIEEILAFMAAYNYINFENTLGENILIASFEAKPSLITYCLEYNADPFIKTKKNLNFVDYIKPYIDKTLTGNFKNKPIILHYCAAATLTNNNKKFILELIENGLNINHKDDQGNSVLHWAADFSNFSMIKFLIEKGADPFLLNNNKENIMHKMSSKRFSQTNYEYFLNLGCDPNQENTKGQNVFDIALEYSIVNLQQLIGCEEIKYFINKYTLMKINNILGECFKKYNSPFLEDEGLDKLKTILQKHSLEQKYEIKKNKKRKML